MKIRLLIFPANVLLLALHLARAADAPTGFADGPPEADAAVKALPNPSDLGKIKRTSDGIVWAVGPGSASISNAATIMIPPGFRVTDSKGATAFLRKQNRHAAGNEAALLFSEAQEWFMIAVFEPIGHFDLAAAAEPDAVALAEKLSGTNAPPGLDAASPLHFARFATEPTLDREERTLKWTAGMMDGNASASNELVTCFFGRDSMVRLHFVGVPPGARGLAEKILGGFRFKYSKRYTDHQPGDVTAELALEDLITSAPAYSAVGTVAPGTVAAAAPVAGSNSTIGGMPVWAAGLFKNGEDLAIAAGVVTATALLGVMVAMWVLIRRRNRLLTAAGEQVNGIFAPPAGINDGAIPSARPARPPMSEPYIYYNMTSPFTARRPAGREEETAPATAGNGKVDYQLVEAVVRAVLSSRELHSFLVKHVAAAERDEAAMNAERAEAEAPRMNGTHKQSNRSADEPAHVGTQS